MSRLPALFLGQCQGKFDEAPVTEGMALFEAEAGGGPFLHFATMDFGAAL